MARAKSSASSAQSSATIGFEAKLWLTADKLRNNMDAAEYKHVVLGLIFLKYISDTFEGHRAKLLAGQADYAGANAEDPDEYKAENVFWVPADARWPHLQSSAKQPTIGKTVDDAMVAIERDNPRLKGVLPKDYARPGLDKQRLGELIDLIATIDLIASNQPSPLPSPSGRGSEDGLPSTSGRGAGGEGRPTHRSVDLLGRVYEYFLTRFASAEGKNGGQFYTPSCVVRCLVEMLAPYKGRIYDPACGSGGMFVQSEKFVESHGGKLGDISIYGQESNATTRRLAVMNLALRGIEADFGPEHADTFRRDIHPDLRADYVLANPPFNDSDWFRKDDDVRWQFGVPPKGNANFRVGEKRTSVVLFGHRDFEDMDRSDRSRATYQHCCLRYVMNEKMTNQTLRERFRLSEKKTESVSRAIRDAVDAGKIKLTDPEQTSLRYRNYVPFWA